MFKAVEQKIKNKNKILFSYDSECLLDLQEQLAQSSRKVIILWALDCVKITLQRFEEQFPHESRPRRAVELCQMWANGYIKMPLAKRAILDCHAFAKEIQDNEGIALAHAIGHSGATVHVSSHALGLVFYELTSYVYRYKENYQQFVIDKIAFYMQKLAYWQENIANYDGEWAKFIN